MQDNNNRAGWRRKLGAIFAALMLLPIPTYAAGLAFDSTLSWNYGGSFSPWTGFGGGSSSTNEAQLNLNGSTMGQTSFSFSSGQTLTFTTVDNTNGTTGVVWAGSNGNAQIKAKWTGQDTITLSSGTVTVNASVVDLNNSSASATISNNMFSHPHHGPVNFSHTSPLFYQSSSSGGSPVIPTPEIVVTITFSAGSAGTISATPTTLDLQIQ